MKTQERIKLLEGLLEETNRMHLRREEYRDWLDRRDAALGKILVTTKQETKTMRKLTDHKLNGLNEALDVSVLDEPGQGGACHRYGICWGDAEDSTGQSQRTLVIDFQNGPILEAGVNGISQEALLAIVIDRLRSFQAGPYACRENAIALTSSEEALMWLQKRTRDRLARGVEGTNQK